MSADDRIVSQPTRRQLDDELNRWRQIQAEHDQRNQTARTPATG